MPTLDELLAELSRIVVSNNWDLSKPGREYDGKRQYFGPDHPIQEEIKTFGRGLRQSQSMFERLVGYGLEAKGHFFRSEETAVIRGWKHPEFAEYFAHWFYSDPMHVDSETRKQLQRLLRAPAQVKIEKGDTQFRYRRVAGSV